MIHRSGLPYVNYDMYTLFYQITEDTFIVDKLHKQQNGNKDINNNILKVKTFQASEVYILVNALDHDGS